MSDLDKLFSDYGAHHTHPLNKATHFVGIPLIAACLLGLGSKVRLLEVAGLSLDLGIVLAAALVTVYLGWHVGLALGIGALLALLYLIGRWLPAAWLWGTLAVGVALQYVGHYLFERRAPAFHRNLMHTLVGPLWVAACLFRRLGELARPGK